ncbi:MAG: hypothetical protein ACRC5T_10290 [Cetobacterium sp.]
MRYKIENYFATETFEELVKLENGNGIIECFEINNNLGWLVFDEESKTIKSISFDPARETWDGKAIVINQAKIDELQGFEDARFIESELRATNKFDLLAYRNLVSRNGDDIEEMDSYRESLLDMKTVALFTLNRPSKPTWSNKYN